MTYKNPLLYTPDQLQSIEEKKTATLEYCERELALLAQKLGYQERDSIGALGLTPEEISKISWTKNFKGARFFSADRKDGGTVKAIIKALKTTSPAFAADIFSPAFFEGHGGNHDFNESELENNLKMALELPLFQKK